MKITPGISEMMFEQEMTGVMREIERLSAKELVAWKILSKVFNKVIKEHQAGDQVEIEFEGPVV